jgi:nicotinate-nucleotide adenylyltransferase
VDRFGILGGTFNPPHLGHLALARHARDELGLGRVLLMPAFRSPGKPPEDDPGPGHRLEMCRLAVADVEGVEACPLEIERDGTSYTVDTLRALHAAHPNIEITFILGADVARTLSSWHESHELPALAKFAVALRPGMEAEPIDLLPREWRGQPEAGEGPAFPIIPLSMPAIDISSSTVRRRLRHGLPVDGFVGPAVASYIAARGLYHAAVAEAHAP